MNDFLAQLRARLDELIEFLSSNAKAAAHVVVDQAFEMLLEYFEGLANKYLPLVVEAEASPA